MPNPDEAVLGQSGSPDIRVSVIVAAHNAADTIAETLQSLLRQTFPHWEAIIVDDGSIDCTAEVVQEFLQEDSRFRLVTQSQTGVSTARNNGITQARFEWLLFLDADDWIMPRHLERLTQALTNDRELDAVYCGWAYVTPDNEYFFAEFYNRTGDLFAEFAKCCVSVIHTFIASKQLVQAAGGFDPAFRTCEDWDLWQRIARAGARFGGVPEILAAYRMRPGSATSNGRQLLTDGLRVLSQGHSSDSRVPWSHLGYPDGVPETTLAKSTFYLACACGGYLIGKKEDARLLLDALDGVQGVNLNPYEVANCLFKHAMASAAQPRNQWGRLWPDLRECLDGFLAALETRSGTTDLAWRAQAYVKDLMFRHATDPTLARRIGTARAWLHLASREQVENVCRVFRAAKRWIWVAVLMAPELKRFAFRVKQSINANVERPLVSEKTDPKGHFETLFTEHPDPWDYTNSYEQAKYEQTLAMIPDEPIQDALELGCAEGHFTTQLAPRVASLLAVDISRTAVERAAERCRGSQNIRFQCLDFTRDLIPGKFDLIVCSEVLYFVGGRNNLRYTARRLVQYLNPGGYLVMAHANVLVDDPVHPGFDWGHQFGAKVIGETFATNRLLRFVKELCTPLYHIQLFQRQGRPRLLSQSYEPEVVEMAETGVLPPAVATQVLWFATTQLPILSYQGICLDPQDKTTPGGVTREAFKSQLQYLRDAGYQNVSLETWRGVVDHKTYLAGRSVLITFDTVSPDFLDYAWPLLKRYEFPPLVFLGREELQGVRSERKTRRSLLSWKDLRQLQSEGARFGARLERPRTLTSFAPWDMFQEMKQVRQALENELGMPISAVAYPSGKFGWLTPYLAGLCGYEFGLSEKSGVCEMKHSMLALPRVRVEQAECLETLAAKLESKTQDSTLGKIQGTSNLPFDKKATLTG